MRNPLIGFMLLFLSACATAPVPQAQDRKGPAGLSSRAERLFDDMLHEEERAECRERTGNSVCAPPPPAPVQAPTPGK
ncbi:hypothetical protein HY632_00180 [Candidatus Uhrbacteria bacterium]|nr:hypothetical protein [Candidatus Uhrbacteria bacterium]